MGSHIVNSSTCCLFHLEKERWQAEVLTKPKLRSYINFKTEYGETGEYVQKVRIKPHRSLLARLRGGTAPLQIETGRYIGLPVEERICRSCNTGQVEDEQHFCVECPALEEARAPLLHLLNLHHVDSGAVSDEDKFISIMQSPDSRTAKLLYNMFCKVFLTTTFYNIRLVSRGVGWELYTHVTEIKIIIIIIPIN